MIGKALGTLRSDAGESIKLLDELLYWLGSRRETLIDDCFVFQPYLLFPLPLVKGKGKEIYRRGTSSLLNTPLT